ncbi:hypothetical protein ACM720_02140 [Neisseria sp. LNP16475]|uniref:hypothetical protein n=1 Tax=Neisseria mucosa TaxID=488 RepID=UPI001F3D0BF0|nr:hypothetical protein [Neisseria mucosa]
MVEARQAAENARRLLASGQDPVKPSNKKSVNGKLLSVIPFGTLPPSGINTVKQD